MCAVRAVWEEFGFLFRNETEQAKKLTPTLCFSLVSSRDEESGEGSWEPRRADKVPSPALSQQHPALWTQEDPAFKG